MKNTILVYCMFLFLASCYLPVENEYAIIEETAVESEDETDEIIIIQEVQSMELQPINEYEGYVKQESRVFGITGNELEVIVLLDMEGNKHKPEKFFVKDGLIYLSIEVVEQGDAIPDTDPVQYPNVLREYFFEQKDGNLQWVDDLIEEPPSERVQFSDPKFQINNATYGELETSNVLQMPLVEAYIKIDGCKRVSNGLWFSVPESYSSRLKGVYFWPIDAGKTIRIKDEGRIW